MPPSSGERFGSARSRAGASLSGSPSFGIGGPDRRPWRTCRPSRRTGGLRSWGWTFPSHIRNGFSTFSASMTSRRSSGECGASRDESRSSSTGRLGRGGGSGRPMTCVAAVSSSESPEREGPSLRSGRSGCRTAGTTSRAPSRSARQPSPAWLRLETSLAGFPRLGSGHSTRTGHAALRCWPRSGRGSLWAASSRRIPGPAGSTWPTCSARGSACRLRRSAMPSPPTTRSMR